MKLVELCYELSVTMQQVYKLDLAIISLKYFAIQQVYMAWSNLNELLKMHESYVVKLVMIASENINIRFDCCFFT